MIGELGYWGYIKVHIDDLEESGDLGNCWILLIGGMGNLGIWGLRVCGFEDCEINILEDLGIGG